MSVQECLVELDRDRVSLRAVDTANTDLDQAAYDANIERCFENVRAGVPADERCSTYDQTYTEFFPAGTPPTSDRCEDLGVTGLG